MIVDELVNGNIASGSLDQTVIIWNMENYTKVSSFNPNTQQIYCLLSLSDGSLALAGKDQSVYFWNITNQNAPFQISSYSNLITASQKPFYSCLVHNNTIYLSNAKGLINSLSLALSVGSQLANTFNSAEVNQIYAIEILGIHF